MVLLEAHTYGSNARDRVGPTTSQADEDQLFAEIELANSGDSAATKGGPDCDNAAPQIG